MVIKADDYGLEAVEYSAGSLEVQFVDGMTGTVPLEELSVGSSISEVNEASITNSDGERVQFIQEDGSSVNYPWDFFRRIIDKEFRQREQEESRRAREKLGEKIRDLLFFMYEGHLSSPISPLSELPAIYGGKPSTHIP